jgi:hypothetical protein
LHAESAATETGTASWQASETLCRYVVVGVEASERGALEETTVKTAKTSMRENDTSKILLSHVAEYGTWRPTFQMAGMPYSAKCTDPRINSVNDQ